MGSLLNEETLKRLHRELNESSHIHENAQNVSNLLIKLWDGSGVAEGNGWTLERDKPWDYTYEVAVHVALAILQEFLPDWHRCFASQPELIPQHIPEYYPEQLINTLKHWLEHPHAARPTTRETVYYWIKDDICLDGYLAQTHPSIPPVIESFCMCGTYLIEIDIKTDIPGDDYKICLGEISREWVGDGAAWFLPLDPHTHRIRFALLKYFEAYQA
jgi:hypothetical protein